ncbi:MAG: hypothetical protein LBE75_03145, partial [Burkholderiales bacterium]|nr:hypothetical protein [Burkholderiales bacterium]
GASREFSSETINIEGRSRAAYLAAPYAPPRSFTPSVAFTARQLAEQELTRAGLITGFDLQWGLPDWLVPAGAWGYQALTPVSVIQQIAGAVGGYVNAHHYTRSLLVKSRYPHLPWEWDAATPDHVIPIEAVKAMSLNWNEKPDYNAVYVSGERIGVTARVLRTGSAGDIPAQMATDPLITHVDAARERGRSILGDTGRQASVTITLPMYAMLGLVTPGELLETGKTSKRWRGLVRSTSVSAEFSDSLIVRQTIGVERHYK